MSEPPVWNTREEEQAAVGGAFLLGFAIGVMVTVLAVLLVT